MGITMRRAWGLWILGLALVGFGTVAGCLSDEDAGSGSGGTGGNGDGTGGAEGGADPGAGTGGAGPSSGGGAGNAATGGVPSDTVCAVPIVLASSTPGIATFDNYDGGADLDTWSFALGGDSSTGVYSGPFGYGDDAGGMPEQFTMVDGHDSTYALSIADTLAEEYGGGMGLWLSECLDASALSGVSFWVRGSGPMGTARVSLLMGPTTPSSGGESIGTCPGDEETCLHPTYTFPLDDDWTQIEVAWGDFELGNANGLDVTPDGSDIWQIQFDVGLEWVPDDEGVYQPTPAGYEFQLDDLAFY